VDTTHRTKTNKTNRKINPQTQTTLDTHTEQRQTKQTGKSIHRHKQHLDKTQRTKTSKTNRQINPQTHVCCIHCCLCLWIDLPVCFVCLWSVCCIQCNRQQWIQHTEQRQIKQTGKSIHRHRQHWINTQNKDKQNKQVNQSTDTDNIWIQHREQRQTKQTGKSIHRHRQQWIQHTEKRQTKQTGKSIHRHRQQWIQHTEQRQTKQTSK
jgi:predicted outer membrane lipoprotein